MESRIPCNRTSWTPLIVNHGPGSPKSANPMGVDRQHPVHPVHHINTPCWLASLSSSKCCRADEQIWPGKRFWRSEHKSILSVMNQLSRSPSTDSKAALCSLAGEHFPFDVTWIFPSLLHFHSGNIDWNRQLRNATLKHVKRKGEL